MLLVSCWYVAHELLASCRQVARELPQVARQLLASFSSTASRYRAPKALLNAVLQAL